MAGMTVFVSVIVRKDWEPRISVFQGRAELLIDLIEYHNEMAEDAEPITGAMCESEITDAISEALDEEVHIEKTCLVLNEAS